MWEIERIRHGPDPIAKAYSSMNDRTRRRTKTVRADVPAGSGADSQWADLAARPAGIHTRPRRRAADADAAANGRSSIARMFDILDLFSIETATLNVEEIAARLNFTRSMAYRYMKELSDAGLVAPVGRGAYALGPRILELERQLHLSDPVLQAAIPEMQALAKADPDSVFLLCNLYRDKVLCVHHEGPETLLDKGKRIPIRRARGLPFPLFVGAASLAILAWLPPYQIRSLFLRHHADIAQAGLGEEWDAFRRALAEIRRAGYVRTSAQINRNLVAAAVPVVMPSEDTVLGSLTVVAALDGWSEAREQEAVRMLKAAASDVGQALDSRTRRRAR
jgi:DNA-binding IclR family transcriptional regulator